MKRNEKNKNIKSKNSIESRVRNQESVDKKLVDTNATNLIYMDPKSQKNKQQLLISIKETTRIIIKSNNE